MNYFAFDCKKQGFSHIKNNKECQDSSLSYFDDKIAIAIVCDGHGGDDYVRSAVGSKFGCEIAKKNICDFVANVDKEKLKHNSDQFMLQLKNRIISYWRDAVNNHYKQHPFEESELAVLSDKARKRYLEEGRIESAYGTTLIAAVITPDYWFGIHIGDGKCVAIDQKGNFSQPIPWDEKCFLNSTTSICDTEALNNFRHFYSEERPVAVFVGSDGIDDCFKGDEQMYHFYTIILSSFVVSDAETAKAELLDYLPRLSQQGSGDDVSVAAVFDRDRVTSLKPVKEFVATHKPDTEAVKDAQNNAEQSKHNNGSGSAEKNGETLKSTKELEEILKKKIAEEVHAALKDKTDKERKAEKERKELEEKLEKVRQQTEEEVRKSKEQAEKERKEVEEKLEKAKKAEKAKEAENARLRAEIEEKREKQKKLSAILKIAIPSFIVVMLVVILLFAVGGKDNKDDEKGKLAHDPTSGVIKDLGQQSEPTEEKTDEDIKIGSNEQVGDKTPEPAAKLPVQKPKVTKTVATQAPKKERGGTASSSSKGVDEILDGVDLTNENASNSASNDIDTKEQTREDKANATKETIRKAEKDSENIQEAHEAEAKAAEAKAKAAEAKAKEAEAKAKEAEAKEAEAKAKEAKAKEAKEAEAKEAEAKAKEAENQRKLAEVQQKAEAKTKADACANLLKIDPRYKEALNYYSKENWGPGKKAPKKDVRITHEKNLTALLDMLKNLNDTKCTKEVKVVSKLLDSNQPEKLKHRILNDTTCSKCEEYKLLKWIDAKETKDDVKAFKKKCESKCK